MLSLSSNPSELTEHKSCSVNKPIYLACDNNFNNTKKAKLHEKTISSSSDVEELLEDVNWTISIYSCGKSKLERCNFLNTQNCNQSYSPCRFTRDRFEIFPIRRMCGGPRKKSSTQIAASALWFPFLIFGLTCLLGNAVVIQRKLLSLIKKTNVFKEKQVYNVLVLNLSCADFLMGIYVTVMATEMKRKTDQLDLYFTEYKLCNTLGVLSLLSSQVSLTTLAIISSYRLLGTVNPYKRVHLKIVYVLVILTWTTWIFISVLPLITSEPIATLFSIGIRNSESNSLNSTVFFANEKKLFEYINHFASKNSELKTITSAIQAYPTAHVLVKAVTRFNLVNLQSWTFMGFYSSQYFCSTALVVLSKTLSNNFNLTIIIYDFLTCIYLIIAYLLIWINLSNNRIAAEIRKYLKNKRQIPEKGHNNRIDENHKITRENRKVFWRISLIVATDLLLWIPLCIICFIAWKSFSHYSVFLKFHRNIQLAILCVVPLNSLINPYIYSWYVWKRLFFNLFNKI